MFCSPGALIARGWRGSLVLALESRPPSVRSHRARRSSPRRLGLEARSMLTSRLARQLETRPLVRCLAGVALLALIFRVWAGRRQGVQAGGGGTGTHRHRRRDPQKTVQVFAEYVARTEAVPTVEIRARVSGVLEQVRLPGGSEVKQGQVLFVIQQESTRRRCSRPRPARQGPG